MMVLEQSPFSSGAERVPSRGAALVTAGLAVALTALAGYDIWGDVLLEGRRFSETLQENTLPVVVALALPVGIWWLSAREDARYVATAVQWTLLGCVAMLVLGAVVGTIRLSEGHLEWLDIVTQLSAFGAAVGIFFGIVSAELTAARNDAQRKKRRMASLKANVRDGIVIVESGGNVIDWNEGAADIFGYTKEEMLGRPVWVLVPDRHEASFKREIARIIVAEDRESSNTVTELEGVRKDETEFPLELSLSTWKTAGSRYFAAIIRDISSRRSLQRELLQTQEEERRTIGQELHDGVAAQLTAARMRLEQAAVRTTEDDGEDRLQTVHDLVAESCEDIRRLSRGLNPTGLSEGDLETALRELSRNTKGCSFSTEGIPGDDNPRDPGLQDLDEDMAAHLYYIAQEALSNARKYADADEILLSLRRESDALHLDVEDNGTGFDVSAVDREKSLGLRSMEHRAEVLGGTLTIQSTPGEGTRVICRVPV